MRHTLYFPRIKPHTAIVMPEETLKLILLGTLYLLLFIIEHYAPFFKNRQQHIQHSARNLTLAAANVLISTVIYIIILKHIGDWTLQNKVGLLNFLTLPTIYSFLLAFILIDLWQYIWHRLNHQVTFLWKFHQVHHADKEMDASTGLRFHPIEIIYSNIARLAVIPIIGIQLDHLLMYEAILLPVILFHHSNINLSEQIDRWLRIVTVTPHMHRLHHSDIKSETDSNYASVFSVWDRLFNSYTMRPIEHAITLGLSDKFTVGQWNRLSGMLKIPFLKNI